MIYFSTSNSSSHTVHLSEEKSFLQSLGNFFFMAREKAFDVF
jgi:hypothetical protein